MTKRQSRREMADRHSHANRRGTARPQVYPSGIETPGILLLSLLTGMVGGFVDSIAGDGGLYQDPPGLTRGASPTR